MSSTRRNDVDDDYAALKSRRPKSWWREVDCDDPITLEPISSLDVSPLELQGSLFDGASLARYMVLSGCLENPLTRAALSREDCLKVDAHRSKWRLFRSEEAADDKASSTRLTTLYDALQKSTGGSTANVRAAATTMAALFDLERRAEDSSSPWASSSSTRVADEEEEDEGLTEAYPPLPGLNIGGQPLLLLDGYANLLSGERQPK
jgi:hypothetical protein